VAAFTEADEVVIGGVLQKQTDVVTASDSFSPEQLTGDLCARGLHARAIADPEEIKAAVVSECRAGDVILLMSNGSFGGLRQKLAAALPAARD
jgi:UDP-N-acetylmuramate: L-alanyl-gamma-D-glutamyl-meso-diaminopimelate ligase